jgi:hypothetical protein
MKTEKRSLNIEKETKQANNESEKNQSAEVTEILKSQKQNLSTGQTQYPERVGYHGTDNEKELNSEE